eukprot:1111000-Amphidinium_carterae.1
MNIVKALFSVGLYGAEVGGMSDQRMKDLQASARGALGKGASLRRSAALELMAHGGPSGDPLVVADLSTVRVWQRCIAAGKVQWLFPMASWEGALNRGRGRGPIRNLRQMADRLYWVPTATGWCQCDQFFTWDEADDKVKWDPVLQLCKEVADSRPDFQGLDSGLATQGLSARVRKTVLRILRLPLMLRWEECGMKLVPISSLMSAICAFTVV